MSQPTPAGAIAAQIIVSQNFDNPHFYNDEARLQWKKNLYRQQSKLVDSVDFKTGNPIKTPRFTLKGTFKNPQPGQQSTFYFQGPKNLYYLNGKGHNIQSIVQGLEMQIKLLKSDILKCRIFDNKQPLNEQVIYELLTDGTELFRDRLTEYLMFKKI